MKLVGAFDPAQTTSGEIDVGGNDGDKVLLYNLSTILIKLNFEDGTTGALHPFEANWWRLNGPTPTISWSQFDVLASNANPMSTCTVTLFDAEETIEGVYPAALVYLSAVSNTITISQGSINVLQNDGNVAGTNIIEATQLGSTGSNVLVKNDGTMTVAQYITGVLTALLQLIPGASTPVKIGNTGLLTEILGNLKIDGNNQVVGNETVGGTLGVTGNTSLSTLSTSGAVTMNSASVTNNETVGGTLGVTGNTSLSTLSTSGQATLNSVSVTNNGTVGGTLGVTGNTSLSTVSTSGQATLNSASVTNNQTVGGTLSVTGNTSLSTLSTSGAATLNSASVTNNETVGGTLSVTGNTSLSTVSTSGLATLNSSSITNNETVNGNITVKGTTSLDNGSITTDGVGHIILNNSVGYRAKNASGTARTILWLDTLNVTQVQAGDSNTIQLDDSTGATLIQISGNTTNDFLEFTGSSKLFIVNGSGVNVASIDTNGNMKLKGTLTQSTTP